LERIEYLCLAAAEDRMWWTCALRRNLLTLAPPGAWTLDAGCGAGGLLAVLRHDFPDAAVFGLERDSFAAGLARDRGGAPVTQGAVERMPFREEAFDAVYSADVLCHRGVDPDRALAEIRRCLRPGGRLALNLPAYQWLYSDHDRAVDNARRYRLGEVRAMLGRAGFAAIRATYWNTLLFPLMVARRAFWPATGSEVALLPAPLESLLYAATAFESRLLSWGLRLPFGGSILATGTRT
jgi:SAM-dependent methyltransferase